MDCLKNHISSIAAGIICLFFISCEKEIFITDSDAKLSFSIDTVLFDTVFTTVGSVTKQFKVYNPHKQDIKITSINLAGGTNSSFRLNINGYQQTHAENIEIMGRDSIYIFVEVTVDPVNQNTPMVIHDSILFLTNGNLQDIDLVAWGQDVHIINGEIIQTATWSNDKPYLVYNSMLIDTLQVLTIEPGTKIHFHSRSTMYVSGSLIVNGSSEDPVLFEGDRLEGLYDDVPGQWGGIYFINGSTGNSINYAELRNAVTGIHLGNLYSGSLPPDLVLSNTIVEHMNFAAVSSIGATINAYNCVFTDCGFYGMILTTGGSYEFNHCTIGNYWSYSNRITPSLLITNYYNLNDTVLFTGDLMSARFGNCIIYGDRVTEIGIDELEDRGEFNFIFDHCLIKADPARVDISDPLSFKNIFLNTDPGFVSVPEDDYRLDTLSFAKDKGSIDIGNIFPFDILQQDRTIDQGPDLGAYERIEGR